MRNSRVLRLSRSGSNELHIKLSTSFIANILGPERKPSLSS